MYNILFTELGKLVLILVWNIILKFCIFKHWNRNWDLNFVFTRTETLPVNPYKISKFPVQSNIKLKIKYYRTTKTDHRPVIGLPWRYGVRCSLSWGRLLSFPNPATLNSELPPPVPAQGYNIMVVCYLRKKYSLITFYKKKKN